MRLVKLNTLGMSFMNLRRFSLPVLMLFLEMAPLPAAEIELVGNAQKIWDAAPHNAFTDLVRFQNEWFCVFREGAAHVSPDGALRVISSTDGENWKSVACLTNAGDLRDAKISVTPRQQLMLTGAAAYREPAPIRHVSMAWFSKDGQRWSEPTVIGETNVWLWRVTWQKDTAYGVGYETTMEKFTRLYRSNDGKQFDIIVPKFFDQGFPNESALVFRPDQTAVCLLRRDGPAGSAQLGTARPPYSEWTWKDLGAKIGGPHMIQLPDGRLLAAVRLYDGTVRTSLVWIDEAKGELREALRLPSGGDSSYAGLVWHEGAAGGATGVQPNLWVSYYSSHESKTSIYLARARVRQ